MSRKCWFSKRLLCRLLFPFSNLIPFACGAQWQGWRKAALIGMHAFTDTLLHWSKVNKPSPRGKKNLLERDISKMAFSHLWNTFQNWPPAGWPRRVSTVWDLLTPLSAGNQANLNLHNLLKTLASARERPINLGAWLSLHYGEMGYETRQSAAETWKEGKSHLSQLHLCNCTKAISKHTPWNCSLKDGGISKEVCAILTMHWPLAKTPPSSLIHPPTLPPWLLQGIFVIEAPIRNPALLNCNHTKVVHNVMTTVRSQGHLQENSYFTYWRYPSSSWANKQKELWAQASEDLKRGLGRPSFKSKPVHRGSPSKKDSNSGN
jgi:hypothetical protein